MTSNDSSNPQAIIGFKQDAAGDWIAVLACGHTQHARHDPPWELRPWVETPEGRAKMVGHRLDCKKCFYGDPIPTHTNEKN